MIVRDLESSHDRSTELSSFGANVLGGRSAQRFVATRVVGAASLAVAFALAFAACDGDASDSESSIDEVRVTDGAADPDDTTPPTTREPEPTTTITTTATAAAAPAGPVVAAAAPFDPVASTARIVPYGDGFVRVRSDDGVVIVSVSDDGSTWRDIESIPELAGLPYLLSSNGERIALLVHFVDGTAPPTPWVSDDGGATWTSLPLPPMTSATTEFVTSEFNIGSIAMSGPAMVVVGQVHERVDWAAYSKDVLGADHGRATGEGGGPEAWTVSFEDGFELTLNLASAGLPALMPPDNVTVLTHDGVNWLEPTEIGLTGPDLSIPPVVSGPAGFVVLAGAQAHVSTDGMSWEAHPVPDRGSTGFGFALVGGPLGYVLVGTDVLYRSLDAVEWADVYEFEDLDPPEMSSQPAKNPSAGGAGFVVPIVDGMGAAPTARYLWSADGIVWTEQPLPSGVQFVDSAVSDSISLVVPFLATDPTASMPTLPANDADLVRAITQAFHGDEIIDPDGRVVWTSRVNELEATCIADQLVEAVGADRLRELRFGAFPFTLLGYGLSLPIELDEATVIAGVLRSCSPSWELLMITSATQGTDRISDASASCVQSALDDDVAAEIFAIELARPYDDAPSVGGPDLSHLEPMIAAFDDCLTPQELNAIDWN